MPNGDAARARFREAFTDFQRGIRERGPEVARSIAAPERFEKFTDASTRASQILALIFLGPIIVANLAILEAFNGVMTGVFQGGDWTSSGGGDDAIGFFITLITLGSLVMSAWVWFQWVRTSGFGFFTWGQE